MKRVKMRIEEMPGALDGLNNALQNAMVIMSQKNVTEATASISIKIELDAMSRPKITYKSTIRVPMEIKETGTAVNAAQVYWDEDLHSFAMEITGEQVKLEA